ncbi:hypothetical protein LIER_04894 [Lithospermum erythrorhizon]|uniref:Uncharacterized protein n=1 Tax=Lithospermum erythrorhizon TaxID=34254 RepID=A0AAV3NZC5_LITER
MSTEKQAVMAKDLVEEAKKRIVLLVVCVVGLSYLMSLTSSSVLVNLPAAALLIIITRYFSLDLEMRRKAATYKGKSYTANDATQRKPLDRSQAKNNNWRQKVNSPVVESAMDQFTRHIVSEWVTDLWYSRVTPDKQGPEALVQIINGVLAEISCRMKNINLINLLISDVVGVVCVNLELFRASKTKVTNLQSKTLTIEELDIEIKYVLAAENKLHPALFSPEAEHKVLQHLMDGLISFTFTPEDLQCSLFRYITRELLACVVMRPVLNLASPRFINERIESLAMTLKKSDKGNMETRATFHSEADKTADSFSTFPDPSVKGVELVTVKKEEPKPDRDALDRTIGTLGSKDPLLSVDTKSRSWSASAPELHKNDGKGLPRHPSGNEWSERLDVLSRQKTKALAPEHFDDMWSRGRNYFSNEDPSRLADPVPRDQNSQMDKSVNHLNASVKGKGRQSRDSLFDKSNCNANSNPISFSYQEEDEEVNTNSDYTESKSTSSYTTEDEESNIVTGLDSPSVKVWDRKNRKSVNRIHHPLENFEGRKIRKKIIDGSQRLLGSQSKRKKSRLNRHKGNVWQEVERSSFLSGDGQDVLNNNRGDGKYEDVTDDSETEILYRIGSEATSSSCISLTSLPESHMTSSFSNAPVTSDSFWKLRCEVLGANIVKSGSRTFAVYSISVTDVNNHCWSIKRRFQHFEELHRRLKEFPEYNLHLPPKHFLSTGLDLYVIQERSILLDKYLKDLLKLPTVSDSIEVWDFLSVDSQTYLFSNPLSILETLSVDIGHDAHGNMRGHHDNVEPNTDQLSSKFRQAKLESEKSAPYVKHEYIANRSRFNTGRAVSPSKKPVKDSSSESDDMVQKPESINRVLRKGEKEGDGGLKVLSQPHNDDSSDPTLPSEWVPPNLSLPIMDLVDVIFQLQDGGWIRRKAFWVAKQLLQLGMGDAFDDWLIEKVQFLRRGSVIASGIARLEQILWPDGIFITKHPKRQKTTSTSRPSLNSHHSQPSTPVSSPTVEDIQTLEEVQQKEAERRAKFVYELMIDKAPQAIVGLVGRKEYEQSANDLYSFIQSPVCVKKLVLDLVELILLSAFPELDSIFRQVHEEKDRFGVLKRN